MKKASRKYPFNIKRKLGAIYRNNTIMDECVLQNIKRIYYLSFIVIPLRLLNIFLLLNAGVVSDTWGQGIFICHITLLILWVGIFIATYKLKEKLLANTLAYILQYIVPVSIMVSGIIIVTIDQMETTSISPFILVSIVVGAVFLIRPLVSGIIFFTSYLVYYNLIAITITSQEVLLSNRVNGITAIALGFFLSVLIWRYNYINIIQNRRIEVQQRRLEQMAFSDPLTKLYNRHFFNKMIKKEYSSVRRYGHESVIIMLDLDDFKKINDSYGHLIGDQVLVQVAKLLRSNIRESDTLARFGGEEFIILAPQISLEEGEAFAEKLRKLIAETSFETGETTIHITASFGVSKLHKEQNLELENYISHADFGLHLAKNRGKNRVEKSAHPMKGERQ